MSLPFQASTFLEIAAQAQQRIRQEIVEELSVICLENKSPVYQIKADLENAASMAITSLRIQRPGNWSVVKFRILQTMMEEQGFVIQTSSDADFTVSFAHQNQGQDRDHTE